MKKVLLSLLMVAGLGFAASAQTEGAVNKISVGPEFALPIGDFGDVYSVGFGGSVQGELNVAKSLNLTGSAGYLSFSYKKEIKDFYKSLGAPLKNDGIIPLKVGAKYYFGGNFYGAGEVGAAIATGEGSGTAFAYSPTLGASFSVADKSSIDLGIRYEGWSKNGSNISFIGIRAAFAFGL
jgi:opacity protein-like surface antigen